MYINSINKLLKRLRNFLYLQKNSLCIVKPVNSHEPQSLQVYLASLFSETELCHLTWHFAYMCFKYDMCSSIKSHKIT